jgi:hypothetical protein
MEEEEAREKIRQEILEEEKMKAKELVNKY